MNIKGTARTWGKLFTMSAASLLLASQAAVAESTGGATSAQSQQSQNMPSGAAPSVSQSDDVNTPNSQVEAPRRDESLTREQQKRQVERDQRTSGTTQQQSQSGTAGAERQGQGATGADQQQQERSTTGLTTGTQRNQQLQTQQEQQAQQNQQSTQGQQQGQQADPAVAAVISITAITEVPVEDIPGRKVVNLQGEEIGEVEDVVTREETMESGLVVSVGGVLGIGDKEVFVDLDDVHLNEDTVVWEGRAGEDALADLPEYNEDSYISAR